MPSPWESDPAIPSEVREGLQKFSATLQSAFGDQLVAIILYGGLAKGEFNARTSDVNVLVVLERVSVDLLDRMLPAIDQARIDFRLSLMTLAQTDLAVSIDVFPTKFLDMQRHHRVLFGKEVLQPLEITRDRLRRQCAREIQNVLMRLRQFYLQHSRRPELLERTLGQVLSAFLTNLATVIELQTGIAPSSKAGVIEAAGKTGRNRSRPRA